MDQGSVGVVAVEEGGAVPVAAASAGDVPEAKEPQSMSLDPVAGVEVVVGVVVAVVGVVVAAEVVVVADWAGLAPLRRREEAAEGGGGRRPPVEEREEAGEAREGREESALGAADPLARFFVALCLRETVIVSPSLSE